MARETPGGLSDVWAALNRQGYALTDDRELGLPANLCSEFRRQYFRSPPLRHDDGDWPLDRLRARDVIRYQRRDGALVLREHESITITGRSGIPGKREHSRILLLEDTRAATLVSALLQLVPPNRRRPEGTFGINLFRTFTNVVTMPHHDKEEFVIICVLGRVGSGAEIYLYQPRDVSDSGEPLAKPILRRQLNPGDIIIFEDRLFKHGATPLENSPNGTALRDALVCTVDHWNTYLAE